MAKVIAVYNRKGGVGKTTSLLNLGAEFALLGKRVLLVDGDSQMNLTQYFFSDELDIEIGIDPNECILSQGRTKPGVDTPSSKIKCLYLVPSEPSNDPQKENLKINLKP